MGYMVKEVFDKIRSRGISYVFSRTLEVVRGRLGETDYGIEERKCMGLFRSKSKGKENEVINKEYEARKFNLQKELEFRKATIRIAKKEDENYALPDDKPLTKEQKEEIDAFWKKYEFMGKIDYRAFQAFYNRSGIFDPRYVPHYITKFYLRPNTAPQKYITAFQNKAYLPVLLSNVKQPDTIVRKIEGLYYDRDSNHISLKEAVDICLETLNGGREIVVKPSGLAGGKGVEFLSSATEEELTKVFREKGRLFVVQKAIRQHPEMAALNQSTVNTVRLTTFLYKGKFIPAAALIKVGSPNVRVDNYKHGGCLLGVNMDGSVLPWALDIDRRRITELPSGVKLGEGGFAQVPCFDSVLKTAEKAHYDIPKIKLISWDIAIDDENEAEIIEANFGGDLRMHQVLTGPVFGDMTEKILDYYMLRKYSKPGITEEFDYNEYADRIEITGYAGHDADVVIPAEIAGKPVKEIGQYAFGFKKEIKSITVPESVEVLRDHCFFGCTSMHTLNINLDNLKTVAASTVNRCYKLDKDFKEKIRALE